MALYDDSRANGLRKLDSRALTSRVKRARTARDRARDLVQKHKLASRARTGSKRGGSGEANQRSKDKAELMADILKRFEQQLKDVQRAERDDARAAAKQAKGKSATRASASGRASGRASAAKAAGRKTASAKKTAAKTGAKKTGAKRTGAKKTVTKKPVTRKQAAKTAAPKKASAAGKGSASKRATRTTTGAARATKPAASGRTRSGGGSTAGRKASRKRRITPEQALEQTRALLEAKQAHDAEPKPWQDLPAGPTDAGEPGFQSDAAARRAKRLHAAEVRLPANQGSISTRDRINQGKRDHRGDTGD
ncbi:hypothetical protein [Luteimonas kalidii]|uniref:Uncharacterized protein n=1 Tax=Luteimonas kalidii TaxID=3042025 RepID=A0ABT6JQC0_9GAMM|nr:hypothetical protein [Luteimonas kalidii]MDH5832886.1 hypothetical protein [Luteimonas kalidii]